MKVRCASCSTASDQPREGWPAANFARMAVIGGAWVSDGTSVLRATESESCAWGVKGKAAEGDAVRTRTAPGSFVEMDVAGLGQRGPPLDVGTDVLAELLGGHRPRLHGF